jgi:uncharacterized protein (TIGR02996 family)
MMNLADAILADVINNPDDDLPRLAYADWLDEHGDELRAEFIRAQIRLARMSEDDPEREALQMRCWEMLTSWRRLAGDLGPLLPTPQPGTFGFFEWFHRGFIETVRAPIHAFARHADAFFAGTPLRALHLERGVWPTDDWPGPPDDPAALERLVSCRSLARITTLNLCRCPLDANSIASLAHCPFLTSLTDLSIRGDEEAMDVLGGSPILRRLTSLELIGDGLVGEATGRALRSIAESDNLGPITHLRLRSGCWDYAASAAAVLAGSPRLAGLTHLNLYTVVLEDAGAVALAASPHLRELRDLDLSSAEIGPDGVQALAASPILASVSHLNLSNNPLGPQGVRALVGSPHLGRLSLLRLWGCGIGPEGARALLEYPFPQRLEHLDLQPDEFGPEQVEALKQRFGPSVWMYRDGKRL